MATAEQFKVGDRVRLVKHYRHSPPLVVGLEGTVVRGPDDGARIDVQFDIFNSPHVGVCVDRFKLIPNKAASADPLSTQVGGDHYKDMPIQPLEFMIANGIPFAEGSVIKYVSRWRKKNGVQDLKKARHLLDVLIAEAEKGAAPGGA